MLFILFLACNRASAPEPPSVRSAVAGEGLSAELVTAGALPERLAKPDGAGLVIFYGGEERGSLEPCGCPDRPRGGVARMAAYVEAARQAAPGAPTMIVNGGYWLEDAMGLDGQPLPDALVLNRWMVAGLRQLAPDALNVGYNDMAGITTVRDAGGTIDLPLVSANARGEGVAPYRIRDLGGLRVGITGITTPGVTFLETPGFQVSDPVKAAEAALDELDGQVDLVVLLAYQAPEQAKRLAKGGRVDVVIDTNMHREFDAPFRVGQAVWVRSHLQTMRLGELRLGVEEGRVAWALDRKIDLDPEVPPRAAEQAVAAQARGEIDRVQREMYRR